MKIVKYVLAAIGVLILVFGAFGVWAYSVMGGFRTVEAEFGGTCTAVTGPGSAEDLLIDRDKARVYISALDRLGGATGERAEDEGGTIATYDLSGNAATFREGQAPGPKMNPHGISLYKDGNGLERLFVLNHVPGGGEAVEIFDIDADGVLSHVKTVTGPELVSPNNIAAVGPDEFYVANDLPGSAVTMDMLFGAGDAVMAHYKNGTMRAVLTGLGSGGGIAASADGSQIYLALTARKEVAVYDRDPATGDLTYRASAFTDMGVDNIDVAPDGALWVAGHPTFIGLIQHFASGGEQPSPSQVTRIPMVDGDPGEPELIYRDTGEEISASSVAAVDGNTLLIGGITPKKFLRCTLP